MRKIGTTLTLVFMALMISQISFGQENDNKKFKFGLGASLFNYSDYVFEHDDEPINSIYMTIDIGNKFRLEPVVAFMYDAGFEAFSIGIGGFGRKSISKFNLLYGLRLGFISEGYISVAPTIGGEYYFIENFSIGSEVQLKGFYYGELAVLTYSSVIMRFYF